MTPVFMPVQPYQPEPKPIISYPPLNQRWFRIQSRAGMDRAFKNIPARIIESKPYLMPDTYLLLLAHKCPECGGKGYYDTFDGEVSCGTCRDNLRNDFEINLI